MQFVHEDIEAEWHDFVDRWRHCSGCPLHQNRHQIVFFRGYIPCDVLFVGEGPGHTEDLDGYPFIGVAGKELDSLIESAIGETMLPVPPKMAFTNAVCCIPVVSKSSGELRDPTPEEVAACAPRLQHFLKLAQPKRTVAVGKVSLGSIAMPSAFRLPHELQEEIPVTPIIHPSALLQLGRVGYAQAYLKTVTKLMGVFESL